MHLHLGTVAIDSYRDRGQIVISAIDLCNTRHYAEFYFSSDKLWTMDNTFSTKKLKALETFITSNKRLFNTTRATQNASFLRKAEIGSYSRGHSDGMLLGIALGVLYVNPSAFKQDIWNALSIYEINHDDFERLYTKVLKEVTLVGEE